MDLSDPGERGVEADDADRVVPDIHLALKKVLLEAIQSEGDLSDGE